MPESYLKGLEEISAIDPETGPAFVEELKKISADFAEYYVAFAFGKIHARQIFEPKLKELIAIATCPATKTQKEVEDGMRSIGYTLDHDLYSRLLLEHRRTNKRTRL